MTRKWGYGLWGFGEWGTGRSLINYQRLQDTWPLDTVRPTNNHALTDILRAWSYLLDQISQTIRWVYDQRRLQTATNEQLTKLANEVGIVRHSNESDKRLRFRALIAKAGSRSDGTLDDIETVLQIIFGSDVTKLSVKPKANSPVTLIKIPSPVLDSIPLDAAALETALDNLLPLGDPIEILSTDRLILGESGNQGLGGKLS